MKNQLLKMLQKNLMICKLQKLNIPFVSLAVNTLIK